MTESRPINGTGERNRGWFFDFYNQWPGVLRPRVHNWHDWNLTVFHIAGENSPYKGSAEIEIGLLGFNLLITCVFRYDEAEAEKLEY